MTIRNGGEPGDPYFTVIVPVHDRAATIAPTLESVAAQSDADFECLVIDDGSSDGPDLAAAVAALGDARFRYIRRENGGGGAARNTGILAARGRYLAFLDSDDLFLPIKLATCRAFLATNPLPALYSQVLVDRGVGRFWPRPDRAIGADEDVGEYLFVANQFIQTSSIVIARDIATQTLFDPTLRKGQDLDFCVRLQRDGVRFTMLPDPLAIWTDVAAHGRTSHLRGYAGPASWLLAARPMLTAKAYHGYRATVLAYYLAPARPFRAALDLLMGAACGGVPVRIVARHALRAYLPRRWYRPLVDRLVARRGVAA